MASLPLLAERRGRDNGRLPSLETIDADLRAIPCPARCRTRHGCDTAIGSQRRKTGKAENGLPLGPGVRIALEEPHLHDARTVGQPKEQHQRRRPDEGPRFELIIP